MNRWKVAQHIISNAWLAWDDDDITLTRVNPTNYQIRYAEDMGEDGRGIDMLADELKPLALALLAHHYKQEQP